MSSGSNSAFFTYICSSSETPQITCLGKNFSHYIQSSLFHFHLSSCDQIVSAVGHAQAICTKDECEAGQELRPPKLLSLPGEGVFLPGRAIFPAFLH